MAVALLGCGSIPDLYPWGTWSPDESETDDHRKAFDWDVGVKFSPPTNRNLLSNGDFADWSGGASADPDSWVSAGAGSSIARITGPAPYVYAARLTRSGTNCTLSQTVAATAYRRRWVAFGLKVKAGTASQARLQIVGTSTASGSYHTGGGDYETLVVTARLSLTETNLTVRLSVETSDGDVDVVGGIFIIDPPHATGDTRLDDAPVDPQTSYVYCYPIDDQELDNGLFTDWPDGLDANAAHWVKAGSGTVTGQSNTISAIGNYFGPYHAAFVGSAGGVTTYRNTVSAEKLARFQGRYVSGGAWTHNAAAGNATVRVVVTDRSGNEMVTTSSSNAGTTAEFLTAAAAWVPTDATAVAVELHCAATATNPRWWGCVLAIGSSAPESTPHAKSADFVAVAGHNLASQGLSVLLQATDTEQTSGGYVTQATLTPTADVATWTTFASVSRKCWRLKITRVAGAKVASIGQISFGSAVSLPLPFVRGTLDWYGRRLSTSTPISEGGVPKERSIRHTPRPLRLELPITEASDMTGAIATFMEHASDKVNGARSGRGLPFFMYYNSVARFCWIADGAGMEAPVGFGLRAERVSLEVQTLNDGA